ncbi:MAG: polyphosphate polymerase domain-containing protein [Candidatus Kapabacteria bacterium]|nr:polyphosphate polymerase domain-containing protein [Ignavibacteriota bacterium]MCW5885894.1 polyphosphate polymerase domain-containing protein [Candidatus Kapabacteria bacterium]
MNSFSLSELNKISPSRRYDTKFICNKSELKNLLKTLSTDFNILDIAGNRIFTYSNLYYDTANLDFFKSHINGNLGRYKLRRRNYKLTGDVFIEVKYKNNKGETNKHRFKSPSLKTNISNFEDEIKTLVKKPLNKLKPQVHVDYKRITLLKPGIFEKVTIDFDLSFQITDGSSIRLPNLIIVEHKSKSTTENREFYSLIKRPDFKKMSLSKYVLGLMLAKPDIKYNSYKPKLITINKICNGINSEYSQFSWSSSFSGISG